MKFLTKFSQWYLRKQRQKQIEKAKQKQGETAIKVYTSLKQLYDFVKWLNTKGLPNRHQKKAFWAKVKNGEPLVEDTIKKLVDSYANKIAKIEIKEK